MYPLVQDTELIYWTKYTSLYSQYMFRNQNKLRSSLYSTIDKNGKIRYDTKTIGFVFKLSKIKVPIFIYYLGSQYTLYLQTISLFSPSVLFLQGIFLMAIFKCL